MAPCRYPPPQSHAVYKLILRRSRSPGGKHLPMGLAAAPLHAANRRPVGALAGHELEAARSRSHAHAWWHSILGCRGLQRPDGYACGDHYSGPCRR